MFNVQDKKRYITSAFRIHFYSNLFPHSDCEAENVQNAHNSSLIRTLCFAVVKRNKINHTIKQTISVKKCQIFSIQLMRACSVPMLPVPGVVRVKIFFPYKFIHQMKNTLLYIGCDMVIRHWLCEPSVIPNSKPRKQKILYPFCHEL